MAWQFLAAGAAFMSGMSAASQYGKAGSAALREARAQAAEIRREKLDVALLATQQHEQRSAQFKQLTDYNEAMSAFMGRTGRSIDALRREEQRRYGRDVDRLREQEKREKDKIEKQAQATEARGRVSKDIYEQKARGSLLDTAFKVGSIL